MYITLEQTRTELYIKLLARLSSVDSFKIEQYIKTGEGRYFHDDEMIRLDEARRHIEEQYKDKIRVVDENITLIEIINIIRSEVRRGIKAVFIENLGLITGSREKATQDKYNEITRILKMLANECDVPVVLCAQQNKLNDEPGLNDLNYVAATDPDVVIFCWGGKLIIAKGRGRQTGIIKEVDFVKKYSRFQEKVINAFPDNEKMDYIHD